GRSGYVQIVDQSGRVVAGDRRGGNLHADGLRPSAVDRIVTTAASHLVDRTYDPRIVAWAPFAPSLRVVATVYRSDFAGEVGSMLIRGSVVFAMTLVLALIQGFLFSRRLSRPIEVVTGMASSIAGGPGRLQTVPVRTNDEVGELATAFNQMT